MDYLFNSLAWSVLGLALGLIIGYLLCCCPGKRRF
jgi:hypothetical protein